MGTPSIPSGRVPIIELLKIARAAMSQPDYRNSKYRKHREAWVLGHFADLYNVWPGASSVLTFAQLGDTAEIPADFAIFAPSCEYVCDVEVAELTDVWDWWKPGIEIPEVDDPWGLLGKLLSKKLEKALHYRTPTWLLIYDNVMSAVFSVLNGVEFGAAEAGRILLSEMNVEESAINCVWVLSSDGHRADRLTGGRVSLTANT